MCLYLRIVPSTPVVHLPSCSYCRCVSATGDHRDCEEFFLWKTEQTNRFYEALRALPDDLRMELLTAYREARLRYPLLGILHRAHAAIRRRAVPSAQREIEDLLRLAGAFGGDASSPQEAG